MLGPVPRSVSFPFALLLLSRNFTVSRNGSGRKQILLDATRVHTQPTAVNCRFSQFVASHSGTGILILVFLAPVLPLGCQIHRITVAVEFKYEYAA